MMVAASQNQEEVLRKQNIFLTYKIKAEMSLHCSMSHTAKERYKLDRVVTELLLMPQ